MVHTIHLHIYAALGFEGIMIVELLTGLHPVVAREVVDDSSTASTISLDIHTHT